MLLRANPMCRRLTASLVVAGFAFLVLLGCARSASGVSESELAEQRANMVLTIQRDAIETVGWTGKTSFDPKVIDAMARVPRHRFVPEDLQHLAYENRPLPIGYGQTISQPYIVALMTDLLAVDEDDVVFELGTGSGYQAAVLAELAAQVYTVEIVPGLSDQAATRLASLDYNNVTVRAGDGYFGWKEHAPFDAIIVTAATDHVPPPLIAQLKPGGRMAIPVGGPFQTQILMLVEKTSEGKLITHQVLPVMFVPVTGPH